MILNNWWDECAHYNIVPSKQTPLVDTIAAYPHCPLFVRKFKEQAVGELARCSRRCASLREETASRDKSSNISISPEHHAS